MKRIKLNEMIITCESCGNVKRFHVDTQEDSERIFKEFRCENNCGRNLYSFITVGSLRRDYQAPKTELNCAIAT